MNKLCKIIDVIKNKNIGVSSIRNINSINTTSSKWIKQPLIEMDEINCCNDTEDDNEIYYDCVESFDQLETDNETDNSLKQYLKNKLCQLELELNKLIYNYSKLHFKYDNGIILNNIKTCKKYIYDMKNLMNKSND